MLLIRLLWLFSVCGVCFMEIQTSSHWMVTEIGLIQQRLDSPFDLARPYDLLAFLDQEKRWDGIFDLFNELTKRQTAIDNLWNDVGIYTEAGRNSISDKECIKAGNINLIDWFAGLLEDGSKKIDLNEFQLPNPYYGPNSGIPDCKRISSLTFSMFAFEHLESMIQREDLSANPEFILPELISPIMTLDQYGHWLTGMLRLNSSSWLHYNMASLYWRVRGSAPKAVECSRRALHYAPRKYKDVALGSLGVVLHRSGQTNDAIIVLNAAIQHDPTNYVSHFTIANAYTVIGQYNTSLKYYNKTIKLNPRMELAQKHKYGVLCHGKLMSKINDIRESLNKLRNELNEYNAKERAWLRLQGEFLRTLKSVEDFEYRNIDKYNDKMSVITGLDIKVLKGQMEKNSLLKYFIDGFPVHIDEQLGKKDGDVLNTIHGLERLIHHVNQKGDIPDVTFNRDHTEDTIETKETSKSSGSIPVKEKPRDTKNGARHSNDKKQQQPASSGDNELTEYESDIFKYPPTMTINRNTEDFDKEIDWPSYKMCKDILPNFSQNVEAVFPVFLPFENKGVMIKTLLTEKLGVPLSEEYELPWHPPTCPQDKEATALTQKKLKQYLTAEVVDKGYLRLKLLEYVSNGDVEAAKQMQDAEIGQRIFVAMKKKIAPKWIVLTLSSLYWRVRNNKVNALHCLLTAARWVQQKYRDIVLVSLGSVYLELGYLDESFNVAEEAYKISLYEPATNFLLAELNLFKKNKNTHMFHLKQVVRVEADFMSGLARYLLNGWACILKQINALQETVVEFREGDICTDVNTRGNMLCDKDGKNCQITTIPKIQCFNSRARETSKLVRLLEENNEVQHTDSDSTFFDKFLENSPTDKADRLAHHTNFDNMVKTIENSLQGCGPAGCKSMKPEDLALKEEDCSYQHLQLGYWLHVISFRQLVADSNIEIPSEISSMGPSNKKVPECRLPSDPLDDFYAEKLLRVNTEDWEPMHTLMHQFAEMFEYYDYITLGAKIAKYVDMRPKSWLGLMGAGWWCGAGGRGACALRCLTAAHALAPQQHSNVALRALVALLHMQSKQKDAKDVAYLSFYTTPKSKIEALLVAVSHAYLAEYEQAVWMYRYALAIDENFMPAKACLHATMCLMFYGDSKGDAKEE